MVSRERGRGDRKAGGGGAHCHCWSLGSRSCFLVHGEMTTGTAKLHVLGKVSVIEVCGCRHKEVTCLGPFWSLHILDMYWDLMRLGLQSCLSRLACEPPMPPHTSGTHYYPRLQCWNYKHMLPCPAFLFTWILSSKLPSLRWHSQPFIDRPSCLPGPYLLILMQVVTLFSLEILSRLSTSSECSQTGINLTETFKFRNVRLGQIELYRTYHLCYKT